MITKEFYINTINSFKERPEMNKNMMLLLHNYYLDINASKYNNRNRIENFNEFINYFNMFINTPVSFGWTEAELIMNMRKNSIKTALDKTINYYNNKFNIA